MIPSRPVVVTLLLAAIVYLCVTAAQVGIAGSNEQLRVQKTIDLGAYGMVILDAPASLAREGQNARGPLYVQVRPGTQVSLTQIPPPTFASGVVTGTATATPSSTAIAAPATATPTATGAPAVAAAPAGATETPTANASPAAATQTPTASPSSTAATPAGITPRSAITCTVLTTPAFRLGFAVTPSSTLIFTTKDGDAITPSQDANSVTVYVQHRGPSVEEDSAGISLLFDDHPLCQSGRNPDLTIRLETAIDGFVRQLKTALFGVGGPLSLAAAALAAWLAQSGRSEQELERRRIRAEFRQNAANLDLNDSTTTVKVAELLRSFRQGGSETDDTLKSVHKQRTEHLCGFLVDRGWKYIDDLITERLALVDLSIVAETTYCKQEFADLRRAIARLSQAPGRAPRDSVRHKFQDALWAGVYFSVAYAVPREGPPAGKAGVREGTQTVNWGGDHTAGIASTNAHDGEVMRDILDLMQGETIGPLQRFLTGLLYGEKYLVDKKKYPQETQYLEELSKPSSSKGAWQALQLSLLKIIEPLANSDPADTTADPVLVERCKDIRKRRENLGSIQGAGGVA